MTNRSHVAVVLGVAGLAVAVAQALLLSSPPTWFQLAVVVFWTLVGGAYLASGLGQRLRARWGPRRSRVPDGEVSTSGPEPDADTTRGADVDRDAHPARPAAGPVPAGPVPAGPVAAAPRAETAVEATAVVPPLATTPVRAARPRGARPRTAPFALPGVRAAVPVPERSPVGVGPGVLAAGRPAPPPLSGAAPLPPPSDVETTDTRMAPWPHAASPVPLAGPAAPAGPAEPAAPAAPATAALPAPAAPAALPAPAVPQVARPETRPTTIVTPSAAPSSVAATRPPAPTAALPVVREDPSAVPDAPAPAPAVSRPVTSPSFAIRAARSPFSFGAAASSPPASGRHAVPEVEPEVEAEPAPASRHRRRHRAASGEQATMARDATPSRTERTHRRRAS